MMTISDPLKLWYCQPQHIPSAGIDLELSDFFTPRPKTEIRQGIAEIHLWGVLVDSAPPALSKLGIVTEYGAISNEIDNALADGAEGILFISSSPGGSVMGAPELAQKIASIEIPTAAHTAALMTSGAYYLAAGADRISATESSISGNIGVISAFYPGEEGVVVLTNEGADLKGTFREWPMRGAQREFLQSQINEAGAEFRAHVENSRAVDTEVFRAGWYGGKKSQELGLIDRVGSLADARAELSSRI